MTIIIFFTIDGAVAIAVSQIGGMLPVPVGQISIQCVTHRIVNHWLVTRLVILATTLRIRHAFFHFTVFSFCFLCDNLGGHYSNFLRVCSCAIFF